jgi:hypothetical protein
VISSAVILATSLGRIILTQGGSVIKTDLSRSRVPGRTVTVYADLFDKDEKYKEKVEAMMMDQPAGSREKYLKELDFELVRSSTAEEFFLPLFSEYFKFRLQLVQELATLAQRKPQTPLKGRDLPPALKAFCMNGLGTKKIDNLDVGICRSVSINAFEGETFLRSSTFEDQIVPFSLKSNEQPFPDPKFVPIPNSPPNYFLVRVNGQFPILDVEEPGKLTLLRKALDKFQEKLREKFDAQYEYEDQFFSADSPGSYLGKLWRTKKDSLLNLPPKLGNGFKVRISDNDIRIGEIPRNGSYNVTKGNVMIQFNGVRLGIHYTRSK